MAEVKEIIEDENKIGTVMADDIDFKGRIVFRDSLKIKGNFEGSIESDGHLIIGMEAKVSADISAGIISVNGAANGKMRASKYIELFSKSSTHADITAPDLFVEKGAEFNGTCSMAEKG
jgi:cytoskeletal protein CcmA (bactofilin family)